MSEQEKQDSQKTIVAFAAGLLIGGLLVWVFGGTPKADKPTDQKVDDQKSTEVKVGEETKVDESGKVVETSKTEMETGDGKIELDTVKAGMTVALKSAVFPTDEGWVGVRDYADGKQGGILGAARYSKVQGLIPKEITLLRPTKSGNEYTIVFFKENGDRTFSSSKDIQVEGFSNVFKVQ
jgi:hypothetical protein